jgi:hypothetical protein
MPCKGIATHHCCWVNGNPCLHLEENTVEGRHWACGLRRELGDWDLVITDSRYIQNVAPHFGEMNCRDWPDGTGANEGTFLQCECDS